MRLTEAEAMTNITHNNIMRLTTSHANRIMDKMKKLSLRKIFKRKGALYLSFFLLAILAAGFYNQVFDDDISYSSDSTYQDESDTINHSLLKIKDLLGGISTNCTLGLGYTVHFLDFLQKIFFKNSSFLSNFAYRAPPAKS